MESQNKKTGDEGEQIAADFLTGLGYRIIERNVRKGPVELDIVAKHGSEIVFVEVKARKGQAWGDPEEFVEGLKQSRLVRAAEAWLEMNRLEEHPCRFDVIAINTGVTPPVIRHYIDAFIAGWN